MVLITSVLVGLVEEIAAAVLLIFFSGIETCNPFPKFHLATSLSSVVWVTWLWLNLL